MVPFNINICFIGNFYKTPVFKAISEALSSYGATSYWILPKKSQYNQFLEDYPQDRLFLLDRSWINKECAPIGDFKINELLFADRIWKYNKLTGASFLRNIQKPIYDFIKNNGIRMVFGEVSWAHEILIHRICSQCVELDCRYCSQMVTRIPRNRFFFFSDEKLSQIIYVKNRKSSVIEDIKVEKPAYLSINDKIIKKKMSLKGLLRRFNLFINNKNIEPTDPNVLTNRLLRMKVVGKEVVNQQMYRFIHRATLNDLEGLKYVFYGFHMQPEASVDVCGRYNEDQAQVVINIWRQLPPGWLLVIKEHSNAIGNRGIKFFKKLLKYPNVVLVNEYTDSHRIIEKAQLVVINTGTLGLESALLGVPAISLSKVYFNVLNYCRYITWQELESFDSLEGLISDIKSMNNNVSDLKLLIQMYSFEGTLGDVYSMPSVLNEENISNLVDAFLSLIEWVLSNGRNN